MIGTMSEAFRIGMIGCGTVGAGVLEILRLRSEELEASAGCPIRVEAIAVRDPNRSRRLPELPVPLTADPMAVATTEGLDLVVEVAGGVDLPRDWMLAALRAGKDVVTANKAALAFHGEEIFGVATTAGRRVHYEASVAAAIPIISVLQEALVGNRITRLSGILNGTCNYILTRMEAAGLEYEDALKEAQEKGFAEADPGLDVGGGDTAHKLGLLAGIMTQSFIPVDSIHTEGITALSPQDTRFAAELGYRIKMLAIARLGEDSTWDLRVHPALLSRDESLAGVDNEYNAVRLRASAAGSMLYVGKGAGSLPTASSVVADIVRAARGRGGASPGMASGLRTAAPPRRAAIEDVELRNYVRLMVLDVPGILGRVTSFLGMRGISIANILQPESRRGRPVPVIVVTHTAKDRVVCEALDELEKAGLLAHPPSRIRIEE